MKWIIVKNATYHIKSKPTLAHSIVYTSMAKTLGITTQVYHDFDTAKDDCKLLDDANPGGDYGVFELENDV